MAVGYRKRQKDGKSSADMVSGLDLCKGVLRFFLSISGLFLLNGSYIVIGAFIFQVLEEHNERHECIVKAKQYLVSEENALTYLEGIGQRIMKGALGNRNDQEVIRQDFNKVLRAFSTNVLKTGYNVSKNCSRLGEPNGPTYQWSLTGALTFAVTVVTTIGYGHIVPKTQWGKWGCIMYSMIGIPFMIALLTRLGGVMADMFKYLYSTICCCGCCPRPRFQQRDQLEPANSRDPNVNIKDAEVDYDDDEFEEGVIISVPLTITVIVTIAFIICGSGLYSLWESWSLIDSCYFCFVTFTTIGFGDMVPGTRNLDSRESKIQLIISGIYQLFAIAMLSMCLQMMVDELEVKLHRMFLKFGLRETSYNQVKSP